MALNKVEICGVNTSKLPLLKEEEKEELFARIKEGDEEAKEKYIKGNLRLVLSVIKRFAGSSENPDDLFQIGCIGLIKAVNNFNTELDVRFSTYAVPMIIGEIRHPGQPFVAGHGVQGDLRQGKLRQEESSGADCPGDIRGNWHFQGGYCLCSGRHSGSGESKRTGIQ